MGELRRRGVLRSANQPAGDLAIRLFCQAYGWTQTSKSTPNVSAHDADGVPYRIKGRHRTQHNGSRQFSGLRDLENKHFDYLAGALFDEDYSVLRAAIVPWDIVVKRSRLNNRTNARIFHLDDDVWCIEGVIDATTKLRNIEL